MAEGPPLIPGREEPGVGREGRQGGEKRTRKQERTHKFYKYIMEIRVKKKSPKNTGMYQPVLLPPNTLGSLDSESSQRQEPMRKQAQTQLPKDQNPGLSTGSPHCFHTDTVPQVEGAEGHVPTEGPVVPGEKVCLST